MSAPLAKGLIIAASVVVAAGIALYENEHFRVWFDERRRQLAVAFYDFGDTVNPGADDSEASTETNRQRRLDIVRRNREVLLRRAREEGIAVDLDELANLGRSGHEMEERRPSNTSFDDLVGADGKLKAEQEVSKASGSMAQSSTVNASTLRHRGAGARGLAAGSSFANPFDDEAGLDHSLIAPSEGEVRSQQSFPPSSIRSLSPRPASSTVPSIIDIPIQDSYDWSSDVPQTQYKSEEELDAEIQEAIRLSLVEPSSPATSIHPSAPSSQDRSATLSPATSADLAGLDDSLYALPSPRAHPFDEIRQSYLYTPAETGHLNPSHSGAQTPTQIASGTLTPTSDISHFSSALSSALESATVADEMEDVHSLSSDDEVFDARSEAGNSEAFSFVGDASTPGSWTDVDSDGEGEALNGSTAVRR